MEDEVQYHKDADCGKKGMRNGRLRR